MKRFNLKMPEVTGFVAIYGGSEDHARFLFGILPKDNGINYHESKMKYQGKALVCPITVQNDVSYLNAISNIAHEMNVLNTPIQEARSMSFGWKLRFTVVLRNDDYFTESNLFMDEIVHREGFSTTTAVHRKALRTRYDFSPTYAWKASGKTLEVLLREQKADKYLLLCRGVGNRDVCKLVTSVIFDYAFDNCVSWEVAEECLAKQSKSFKLLLYLTQEFEGGTHYVG